MLKIQFGRIAHLLSAICMAKTLGLETAAEQAKFFAEAGSKEKYTKIHTTALKK